MNCIRTHQLQFYVKVPEDTIVAANSYVFLLGLAVGTSLLGLGMLLGYLLGNKGASGDPIDRQQFLSFLQNLSSWTSEYSGDVSRYQSQLTAIDEKFRSSADPPREEMLLTLQQIMHANRQLQARLDNAEQKLEIQTDQISSYLTEARTDGLTGLLNRKAFDIALDGLFDDWESKGQCFSMGIIDIDHFKQINDTYGHPAGDTVLRQISELLQSELGEEVCVARYGGEEFAILSLRTGEQTAAALDRTRTRISQLQVTHDTHVISVSLSAGAAQIKADDRIDRLVRRADEALYAAKLGGRNRVYRHDGTICHLVTKGATRAANSAQTLSHLPLAAETTESAIELSQAQAAGAKIADRLQRIVEEESLRLVRR